MSLSSPDPKPHMTTPSTKTTTTSPDNNNPPAEPRVVNPSQRRSMRTTLAPPPPPKQTGTPNDALAPRRKREGSAKLLALPSGRKAFLLRI
ncbi:hypothetical protein SVAN01_01363 [Stagonosporopsis vannaccii]|nr:hypothetical protein SVAN01_01363 [Stagonosporopsis vannaccii]